MVRLILISMTIGLFFSGCAFVPPGTTQLEEKEQKIYMDKNPLTNLAWKEYIYWLKNKHGKNSGNYKKALPDSSVWTDAYPDSGFLSSSYDNKPIVGISLEQAKSYCEWRSKVVTKKFEKKVTYKLADFHSLKKVPESEKFKYNNDLKELTSGGKMVSLGKKIKSVQYNGSKPNLSFRCIATYEQ